VAPHFTQLVDFAEITHFSELRSLEGQEWFNNLNVLSRRADQRTHPKLRLSQARNEQERDPKKGRCTAACNSELGAQELKSLRGDVGLFEQGRRDRAYRPARKANL
jgi:hypothetical protein